MPAYWLTYKPLDESPRGWSLEALRVLVAKLTAGELATEWWRALNRQVRIGDRVYLFKQGTRSPRGIIGVGEVIGGPAEMATPTDSKIAWRVEVQFQYLVDPTDGFLLPLDAISEVLAPTPLVDAVASGTLVPEAVAIELERRLAPVLAAYPAAGAEPADERQRALRALWVRQGQGSFREALMDAYGGRCAVTGCSVAEVLDAAHVSPYSGPSSNLVTNGLLLRTDIHALFDGGLLAFDPITRTVRIAPALKGTEYATMAGVQLREPRLPSQRPDALRLAQRTDLANLKFNFK